MANDGPSLVDLLTQLRSDIDSARAGLLERGEESLLKIDSVEATIQFVAEKTKEGGLRLVIPFLSGVGAGAKLEHSNAATQSITLRLLPRGDIGVAGER